jgi:hypothetical protein
MFFDDYDSLRTALPLSPRSLRPLHIVSAAVYAFTGWPARQAVNLARDLLVEDLARAWASLEHLTKRLNR